MKITREQIEIIEKILQKGDRAEIIPVKNGIKVLKIKRELVIKAESPCRKVGT